jgi:hypothetical protein
VMADGGVAPFPPPSRISLETSLGPTRVGGGGAGEYASA